MIWSMEALTELSTGYWKSCVLSAAVELNLFEALDPHGTSADEAAVRIHASARHTAELLNALAGMGIVEKKGGNFHLTPSAVPFFLKSSPTCLLDALKFNADLYALWGRLGSCVREGKPVLPPAAHLGDDPARTRRFVMGMHSRALGMAPALVPAIDLHGKGTLLDVGAGPGTFSRFLAERHSRLRVTLFDLAPVLAIARELTDATTVAARTQYVPGDYRNDALPDGFDAVLYCGALHQEEPVAARRLFGKLHRSLKPGGVLHVVDMMLAADRTHPLFSVLFSLNMMLISPQGRVFTDEEVRADLAAVGFRDLACLKPEGCPYWIVRAVRPS